MTAAAGVASFTGLSLDQGGDYTFLVTSGPLTDSDHRRLERDAGSAGATGGDGPAAALTTTAGTPFGLAVSAEDTYGNVETSFYGNISVRSRRIDGRPFRHTHRHGQRRAWPSSPALVLDAAGTSYTLQASDGDLTTTTSAMSVTPAPATRLVVTIPPPGTDDRRQQLRADRLGRGRLWQPVDDLR